MGKAGTHRLNADGFSLVELLIAMMVGGIVLAAVMTSFQSQHNVYLAQDQVVELQQNARVAIDMLVRDIRMAGYDPTGSGNAGIVLATGGRLGFTQDSNGNGIVAISPAPPNNYETDEAITYGFSTANDANIDGVADAGSAPLRRNTGTADGTSGGTSSGFQQVAENFQAIEFYYQMADGTQTLTPAVLDDIRSVQVSVLARAAFPDTKTPPPVKTYTTPSGAIWLSTAGYRSMYLTTTVQCRNLGLQ